LRGFQDALELASSLEIQIKSSEEDPIKEKPHGSRVISCEIEPAQVAG